MARPPPCLSLTVVCHLALVCAAARQPPSSAFLSPSPPQFFSASLALPPPASSFAWRRVAALSVSPALGTLCRSLSTLCSVWPTIGSKRTQIQAVHLISPQIFHVSSGFVLEGVIINKNGPIFQHVISGEGLSA